MYIKFLNLKKTLTYFPLNIRVVSIQFGWPGRIALDPFRERRKPRAVTFGRTTAVGRTPLSRLGTGHVRFVHGSPLGFFAFVEITRRRPYIINRPPPGKIERESRRYSTVPAPRATGVGPSLVVPSRHGPF